MGKLDLNKLKSKIRIPGLNRIQSSSINFSRKNIFLTLGGVIVLVLVIVGIYGFYETSQPRFCLGCHEMGPEVESWKSSIHAEVPCNGCHYPGLAGPIKQKIRLIGETYSHFTKKYEGPLNVDSELSKRIDNAGCLRCHTPKRIVTPGKALDKKALEKIHKIHVSNKGVNCTTCHNRAGHNKLAGYESFISMNGCFRCHGLAKTAIAPGRCTACHPKKGFDLRPNSHKTGTWLIPDHPKEAKKDITPCMMCHQKTFCRGCHGVEVPHPDKFRKDEHGNLGKRNPQVCRRCHRQYDFCTSCHHKGYTGPPGGWVFVHFRVVAEVGPAYCFSCHGPTFCAWCHVRGELQPRTKRPPKP